MPHWHAVAATCSSVPAPSTRLHSPVAPHAAAASAAATSTKAQAAAAEGEAAGTGPDGRQVRQTSG